MNQHLEQAAAWLSDAEAILITAGAGLTASAGLNYSDTELFAREFPGMRQHGVNAQYEMIGPRRHDPEVFWGFWAPHVDLVRFRPPPKPLHRELLALVDARVDPEARFVLTSNVDQLFARSGFDPERIHTPQGDYALMQCEVACTNEVWRWDEERNDARAALDVATQRIPIELIPVCRNCGGPAFMNVRKDQYFIEDHWAAGADRLAHWAQTHLTSRGVVLEIGAGWNTPTVVRLPGEAFATNHDGWNLVRVSYDDATVPEHSAVGLEGDAGEIIAQLAT